jgi:copper transporter 1
MLWNWNTIDACTSIQPTPPHCRERLTVRLIAGFISKSWRITSHGMFAGSCIGVILLVMSLEFLRRLSKEYDRYILQQFKQNIILPSSQKLSTTATKFATTTMTTTTTPDSDENNTNCCSPDTTTNVVIPSTSTIHFRPTLIQQSVRALLHMITFAIAYFVMLLAMYYNGYFIICIFIGAYLGAFVFSWESVGVSMGYAAFPFLVTYFYDVLDRLTEYGL